MRSSPESRPRAGDELLARSPMRRSEVDWRGLQLDARDAFILSRIDGQTPVVDLADVVGCSRDELLAALRRLEAAGAICWPGADPSSATQAAACDLSAEERARIDAAARGLEQKTHWEVLGLAGEVSTADVKAAYFALSKVFHPDRYFGRQLGPYKDTLTRVFRAIKEAYDVLSNEALRREYARHHPAPKSAAALTQEQLEARRREIIAERRRRKRASPPPRPVAPEKAREMYTMGMAQLAQGDAVAAANSFKLATTYDPSNTEYQRLYEQAQAEVVLARAKRLAEQAEREAQQGNAARAAAGFVQAFELAGAKGNYAIRAAEELLKAGEPDSAWSMAMRAVELSPKRKEARLVAAEVALARGDAAAATAHIAALSSFDRKDPRVNKLLHRLAKATR